MGMSTFVFGVKPPDEKFKKMKTIWDNCMTLGIEVPREVMQFFNSDAPHPDGVKVSFVDWKNRETLYHPCVHPLDNAPFQTRGFKIEVAKIPADVKFVVVENSW